MTAVLIASGMVAATACHMGAAIVSTLDGILPIKRAMSEMVDGDTDARRGQIDV